MAQGDSLTNGATAPRIDRTEDSVRPSARTIYAQRFFHPFLLIRKGSGRPKRSAAMLVLSRKKNESIVIDDRIVITVVEIRGDKVRLGIEAPRDVPVHRSEVYEAIHRAQESPKPAESEVPTADK
jgi:carbon storage regulator